MSSLISKVFGDRCAAHILDREAAQGLGVEIKFPKIGRKVDESARRQQGADPLEQRDVISLDIEVGVHPFAI